MRNREHASVLSACLAMGCSELECSVFECWGFEEKKEVEAVLAAGSLRDESKRQ